MADPVFVDRTGTIRDPSDFEEAHKIVAKRLISGIPKTPQDIELFVHFTTIIQALEIARAVAIGAKKRGNDGNAPDNG